MTLGEYRAAMGAGIAFVLLAFFGSGPVFGFGPSSKKGESDAAYAARFATKLADSGNRVGLIVGMFLLVLAAIALVWFTSVLRQRLGVAAGSPMAGFATLAAMGIAGTAIGTGAIAGGNVLGGEPVPTDGAAIRLVYETVFPFTVIIFALAIGAFIASATIAAGRTGAWPMWLRVYSWIAAVAAAFSFVFLPIILVLIWFLAVSIHGLVRGPAAVADTATGAAATV